MGEVLVRADERTALVEDAGDLGELLRLDAAQVLKDALRHDDVERHALEGDRFLDEVGLHQVGGRLLDGDVDPVVADAAGQQGGQRSGAAADVEEADLAAARQLADLAGDLPHPEVRLRVLEVLRPPEVALVVADPVLRDTRPRRGP
ncbi:MAG: hypothetical protein M0030_04880 [Actinomycetota bacterium]|nr:hypothetical protein [Actinomycetota bacterium]